LSSARNVKQSLKRSDTVMRNPAKQGLIPLLKREQTPPADVSFQGLVWV